ncbi:hypothetical protein KEM55_002338 [Ascosphaera atra]|nr:hypothetical protein KEM55_002338 [Ascosphaera atra]
MAPQAKKKHSVVTVSIYSDKLCSQCVKTYVQEPSKITCLRDQGVKKNCNGCKEYKKKCMPISSSLDHLEVEVVPAKREYNAAAESNKKNKAPDLVKVCEELLENMEQSENLDGTAAGPAKSKAAADSDSDSGEEGEENSEEETDGPNAAAAAKPAAKPTTGTLPAPVPAPPLLPALRTTSLT